MTTVRASAARPLLRDAGPKPLAVIFGRRAGNLSGNPTFVSPQSRLEGIDPAGKRHG
jgi:hypothetical protein